MKVKIKKLHPNAVIPTYATDGDAGMDLTALTRQYVYSETESEYIEYRTGLAFEIPEGYMGLIFPRSSNSKKDLTLCNSVGVLDSGFRGEVTFRYKLDGTYDEVEGLFENMAFCKDNTSEFGQWIYEVGDKVGQLIILPYPKIEFEEVNELSKTERNEGGFGHTGK